LERGTAGIPARLAATRIDVGSPTNGRAPIRGMDVEVIYCVVPTSRGDGFKDDASKWQILKDLGQNESDSLQFEALPLQSGRIFSNIGTRCANNTPGLAV
jgi:hypothetical protein